PLSDFGRISHELKPCDVLLVEGRSRISDLIRWLTNSPWTHAALYLGRLYDIEDEELRALVQSHYDGDPSDRLVIESQLGQGTIVTPLDAYKADHLRICRPVRLSFEDGQRVIRYAASRLGVDYDVRQIFDLARFLVPWSVLPRRWASTLFIKRSRGRFLGVRSRRMKTVCSTMIAEAFGYVQFPILPLVKRTENNKMRLFRRNPRLCTPSDFDYSPYFEIIKYSFVDFYHEDYHLLPWHGPGELSPDEMGMYVQPDELDAGEVDEAIASAVGGDDKPAGADDKGGKDGG
ncbi:MAG: YiiX/YebB-like N1pC/P60 family cysteine hydrolase, partial [Pseudomonadales bacterium]